MVEELVGRALALHREGRLEEAERLYAEALTQDPHCYPALHILALLRLRQGRSGEALGFIERALRLQTDAAMLTNQGVALEALGRLEEALEALDKAVKLEPRHSRAFANRATLLAKLSRGAEALSDLDQAVALDAGDIALWHARGLLLAKLGRVDAALASFGGALAINPDSPETLAARSNLLWTRKNDLAGATIDLERLVSRVPDFPYAKGDLLHLKMHAGDWADYSHARAELDEGVQAGRRIVEPYIYQALSDSPADLLACARIYAADRFPVQPPVFAARTRKPGKIRIGYVCGEFRAQASMILAAGLFERHDRARFDIIGLDNSREDGSDMRARVTRAFDKFLDIKTLSDRDAARLIGGQNIDILVNLNGYFGAMRMGVFAYRPAPIQVNYLGFPGSLGADYIDYIIADRDVIRPGEERFFAEKIVTLPDSYQINDDKRLAPCATTRPEHGLNDKDFVYCHFNYGYKIVPEMFAVWMRLLKARTGSVLWLLESSPQCAANLKAEAARQGVDPKRLIFAPQMAHQAHVARLALADLFLDSLPYNAHTTASDALWAGLPIITARGNAFAGRVAASLLTAMGVPELVAAGLDSYEGLALALTDDRDGLKAIRAKLAAARGQAPLFDTARTTSELESAYEVMLAAWEKGKTPQNFSVATKEN